MSKATWVWAVLGGLLVACGDEPPARSVDDFMSDSAGLQATLLRCRDGGFEAERDPECVNARQAAERLGAQQEEDKRAEREAEFERQRDVLRQREALRQREEPPGAVDQAESAWPEEEAIEPPLPDDPQAGDATGFPPSDAALEAEIRRLQEELQRRRQRDEGA